MVSEVQGSSSGVVQSTEQRSNQINVNKKADESNQTQTSSAPPPSSSVSLTSAASQLQAAEKSIAAAPVVDQSKVDAVKKTINEGSYNVDAERIASKLIDFDTALPQKKS